MIVDLIAYTVLVPDAIEKMGYKFHEDYDSDGVSHLSDGDELAEVAGRECYQSWGRPNPGTATNAGYMANIIEHGHFSILEHASLTFSIRHVSRSLTHELVRHRHLSVSQVSQRYVDESQGEFVLPPEVVNGRGVVPDILMTDAHQEMLGVYEKVVTLLTDAGVPRKRARQAARYVLPNGHETRLVVTGNVRAWREVVAKRGARNDLTGEPLADLEMHQLACRIMEFLHAMVPNSVQDMWPWFQTTGPATSS